MDSDEQEWIRGCQRGNREAFEPLVRRYRRRAYFIALGLLGNPEDAMEISQEAFLRAFRALGRFDSQRPFFPWLYRILRNLCWNRLRQPGVRVAGNAEEVLDQLPAGPEANPERAARRKEIQDSVWRALSYLPPEQREILILREMEDLPYGEIAGLLGIPIGTVMSRLYNARRELGLRLRAKFKVWEGRHEP